MAAPAGLSSGSAPDPVAEATAEPGAAEPVLAAAGPGAAEQAVMATAPERAAVPEPTAAPGPVLAEEPAGAEPVLVAGKPEPVLAAEPEPELTAEPEPATAEPAERAGKAPGRRLFTVVAAVVGAIVLVGAAVAALAVVTHNFRPKTVVTYRPAAVFGLRAGECINSSPNGLSVTIKSCTTPHDAEVFATFRLAGSSWPGSGAIQQEASSGCVSRVGAYLNPQLANAGFAQEYIFPDQQAWQAGVRTVVCEIRASGGQLTGSVRQPG
jgi:hypothetical protein